MGKGDMRTAKGKRYRGSFGKTRPRKGKKATEKKGE
jgi:30S ribosomal protein S31